MQNEGMGQTPGAEQAGAGTQEGTRAEEFRISGDAVVGKIKELLHEGNVRRIIIKNDEGQTMVEIPLTVGVVGALLVPVWAAIGAIAALAANDTGGTNVSVYIAPEATAMPAGTPVAATEAATETETVVATETMAAVAPQEIQVAIQDFAFAPQVLEVPVGTTVTWINNDPSQHTATASDGSFDSGVLAQGGTFSFTFETPGTYDYICSLHPNMTGQIVVTG